MNPSISLPTRITSHSAILIDNIFTNSHSTLAGTLVCDLSHHLPIFLISTLKKAPSKTSTLGQASKINFQKLNRDLKNYNFPDFKNFVDAYTAYRPNVFLRTIQNKINCHSHYYTKKINRVTHDWITPNIIKSCHKKNLL